MANPNREDQYALPPIGTSWEFKPSGGDRLFICRDSTCSASNAAEEVWLETDIISTVCFVHAGPIWLSKSDHKRFFNDVDNTDVFREDLNTYKLSPFIHMVDSMHEAMIKKWTEAPVSEPLAAEKWENSWGGKRITMVEANEDNPLGGGVPSDNNTLESTNGHDKNFQDRARVASMPVVQNIAAIVEHHSLTDLVFNGDMKDRRSEAGDVHSGAFYAGVQMNFEYDHEFKSSCLCPVWSITSTSNGVKGNIICSDLCLAKLKEEGRIMHNCTMMACDSEVESFRRLIRNPSHFIERNGFDAAGELIRKYHVLSPLDPTDDPSLQVSIKRLHEMLEYNGLEMMPYQDILDLQDRGLVSCTCHCYFLRNWCKHCVTYA